MEQFLQSPNCVLGEMTAVNSQGSTVLGVRYPGSRSVSPIQPSSGISTTVSSSMVAKVPVFFSLDSLEIRPGNKHARVGVPPNSERGLKSWSIVCEEEVQTLTKGKEE